MKTARQAGWSLYMGTTPGLVCLLNEQGDYLEVWANVDGELRWSGDYSVLDCPRSVVTLVCLWLDVQFPEDEPDIAISADGDPVCTN